MNAPQNESENNTSTKLASAITWVLDDSADAGEHLDSNGNDFPDIAGAKAVLADHSADVAVQVAALQSLLDGMHSRGHTHGDGEVIFDSVADAAQELVAAGGSLDWYPQAVPTP